MNAFAPLAILTALFYFLQAGWLMQQLRRQVRLNHRWLLLALLPALLHGGLLHLAIDTPAGQNLSFLHIASLVSWLIILLLLIPTDTLAAPLMLFALPIAGLFTLALLIGGEHLLPLRGQWLSLAHILSAVLAYSLLLVAAVQAVILAYFERSLRRAPTQISPLLPPLNLQEQFLFRLISTGFVLLTASLLVAVLGLRELFASQPLHKTVFAVLAWSVFAILLVGRWRQGWRGRIAVRWTLAGFALLAISYAGTRIVVEYLMSAPA